MHSLHREILLFDYTSRYPHSCAATCRIDEDITALKHSWKLWSVWLNEKDKKYWFSWQRIASTSDFQFPPSEWPNQHILSRQQFFEIRISESLPVKWIHSFTSVVCIIKKLECEHRQHYTIHTTLIYYSSGKNLL